MKSLWKPWFYQGPYVPSGVLYGSPSSPSWCHWLIPGYAVDPPINAIDVYAVDHRGKYYGS